LLPLCRLASLSSLPPSPSLLSSRQSLCIGHTQMFLLLLSLSFLVPSSGMSRVCNEVSFSSRVASWRELQRVERIAVASTTTAFHIDFAVDEDSFQPLLETNGLPLLINSSPSHDPIWTHVDILAKSLRLRRIFETNQEDEELPLVMLTICESGSPILSFDDSPFKVDSIEAGLVSISSLLFFSSAPQGDILIAQCIQGRVHVIFDFGSLTPSSISGGRALDDGKWHDLRWIHQFDSVQLFIDGVLANSTSPSGLYRKLDLNTEIWIGGGPVDELSLPLSPPLQSTFRGCLQRVLLNSIDLLSLAPSDMRSTCIMTSPPSLTLFPSSRAIVPFSFLPFSFEFRLVSTANEFISLRNALNENLVLITVDASNSFVLTSNSTKYTQKSNPAIHVADGSWHSFSLKIRASRMEIEVDGITILWLEGTEVRSMSVNLASIVLSASGCYRSTTLDLQGIPTEGKIERGTCAMTDRCTPNPCVNGGSCVQSSLQAQECKCRDGYSGALCHLTDSPRSCEEYFYLKSLNGRKLSKKEKKVVIDVDGGEPILPFTVECSIRPNEMGEDTVITRLSHQLANPLRVTGITRAGEVRVDLNYRIDITQMEKLVDSFELCSQLMRYECKGGARLMTWEEDRSPSSWYSTRHDKQGLQWGSAPPFSRMCPCALHSNCTSNKLCNCDSGLDGVDEGNNTYSQLLPITSLFVGGTTSTSSVAVSIGPLICQHKLVFETVTFVDRDSRLTGQSSFQDGKMVGEVSIGGESFEVKNTKKINDGVWHDIHWEANSLGQRLRVDDEEEDDHRLIILPRTLNWTIGSRSRRNGIGFAGVLRNVYLNGNPLPLGLIAREENAMGIFEGEKGKCLHHDCSNGGRCVDHFDCYSCDCSLTPFGGDRCTRDHSMWIALDSSLSIPWQNPSQTSLCHRLAIQTASTNVSLVKSRSLFGEASFNLSLTTTGRLSIAVYDGISLRKSQTFGPLNISNEITHDISFCASLSSFKLTVDEQIAFNIQGNFSFFKSFNVWHLIDEQFTGCLSRLQIGSSFPLKDPTTSRLKVKSKGDLQYGRCPSPVPLVSSPFIDSFSESSPTPRHPSTTGLKIGMESPPGSPSLVSITGILGVFIICVLLFVLASLVAYMRSRPEGVYDTNEVSSYPLDHPKCSPSKSDGALVEQPLHPSETEYFC
ncbi:hypothetical protein PMAYCL1PPCAC_32841, partial [Pristionchus mayeri]